MYEPQQKQQHIGKMLGFVPQPNLPRYAGYLQIVKYLRYEH